MNTTENYLRFSAMVVFANHRLIIGVTMAMLILSGLVCLIVPPVYKMEGTIIVKSKRVPDRPESGQTETGRFIMPATQEDAIMETRIVTSPDLVERCVVAMRKEGRPVLDFGKRTDGKIRRADTVELDRQSVAAVTSALEAVIFPGSTMIDVRLRWGDALTGKRILDRILDEYPHFRMQLLVDRSASAFYSEQVQRYRENIDHLDNKDLSLGRTLGVSDASMEMEQLMRTLREEEMEREKLLSQRQELDHELQYTAGIQQRYHRAGNGDSGSTLPPPAELNTEASPSRERLNDMLMSYYTDMRRYADGSASARQVAQRISAELENLVSVEKMKREGLQGQVQTRSSRIDSLRRRTIVLRRLMTRQQQVAIDVELARTKYQAFSGKLDQVQLELGSEISQWASVQVLTRPSLPTHPWFPRPRQVLPFGLLAGLFLGLILAWIRELLDHTFKTPAQVTAILEIPVIASLPYRKRILKRTRS